MRPTVEDIEKAMIEEATRHRPIVTAAAAEPNKIIADAAISAPTFAVEAHCVCGATLNVVTKHAYATQQGQMEYMSALTHEFGKHAVRKAAETIHALHNQPS